MTDTSKLVSVSSKEYNERYRRTRPVMYGDIESLYMALSATDDYLLWLTHVQGWTLPGSGALIRQQVADARAIAKAIYGAGPDEVNAPETGDQLQLVSIAHAARCYVEAREKNQPTYAEYDALFHAVRPAQKAEGGGT